MPGEIDLERQKAGRHLGYGSECSRLGAPLARRELFWAFHALINRVEELSFEPGMNSFEVAPSFSLRAMKELNIEFVAIPDEQRFDHRTLDVSSNATELDNPAKNSNNIPKATHEGKIWQKCLRTWIRKQW